MRCSWTHCQACFEGEVPYGWKLVARHGSTGEQVIVCPQHFEELLQADLSYLLRMRGASSVPRVYPEDELGPQDMTSRQGKVPVK